MVAGGYRRRLSHGHGTPAYVTLAEHSAHQAGVKAEVPRS